MGLKSCAQNSLKNKNSTTVYIYWCIYLLTFQKIDKNKIFLVGASPEDGVKDMIVISDIDENGVNINLKTRYMKDQIYVSFYINM